MKLFKFLSSIEVVSKEGIFINNSLKAFWQEIRPFFLVIFLELFLFSSLSNLKNGEYFFELTKSFNRFEYIISNKI